MPQHCGKQVFASTYVTPGKLNLAAIDVLAHPIMAQNGGGVKTNLRTVPID
jgi:hypothetical protein